MARYCGYDLKEQLRTRLWRPRSSRIGAPTARPTARPTALLAASLQAGDEAGHDGGQSGEQLL